jgi:ABC-type transport system involved in multi-copper enzyme maturation permease subunit
VTPTHRAGLALQKELRALLPTFLFTTGAVIAGGLMDEKVAALVLAVFCWGVVSLGAHAIGHEYSYRTLALLLAQPRRRSWMLAHKAIVLIPLVLALTLVTTLSLPGAGVDPLRDAGAARTLLLLGALSAVSLAPLVAMLSRGTLPATVVTLAIPGVLLLIGEIVATSRYGLRDPQSLWNFKLAFVRSIHIFICAAAALATWWQFGRLQAIDGHQHVHAPTWRLWRASPPAASLARVRRPTWVVFRKELHLQQLSYLVVGMYVIAWVALYLTAGGPSTTPRVALQPLTVMYLGLLSLLIGSVASAEERQLGTLTSQQLLPMPAWKQWAIKAGTALGLALLLGILLPAFLNAVIPVPDDPLTVRVRHELGAALVAVLVLSTLSVYVSSLSGSAVRAMVTSIPVAIGAALYGSATTNVVGRIEYRAVFPLTRQNREEWIAAMTNVQARMEYALLLTVVVMVVLLLRFAYVNHRSDDRRHSRTLMQAAVLIGAFTVCLLSPLLRWR